LPGQVQAVSPVRIETNQRTAVVGARNATVRAGGAGAAFSLESVASAARPAATEAAAPATSLDALLALQAVEDPLLKRRKLVRRGSALLDTLEAMRADVLVGGIGEGRLNQLLALVGQARERAEPELDALIDDIELRARVELAKRGHFPSA
jgi:hypothetical protein